MFEVGLVNMLLDPLVQCNLNLSTFVLVDFIGWQGGKTGV